MRFISDAIECLVCFVVAKENSGVVLAWCGVTGDIIGCEGFWGGTVGCWCCLVTLSN